MEDKMKILPVPGKRNILITSALPYVNNLPHLDEYGTATEARAREVGTTPKELCDKYHDLHAKIYEWFEIDFDIFGRTSTSQQTRITQDIFRSLFKNDYLVTRESRQPYYENHSSFLADRFIEGTCPRCGYDDARGDQCDKCGSVDYEALDLIDPRCKVCPNSTPVVRNTRHIHLRLDKLQPAIEEWFVEACKTGAWSKNAKVITESWLKEGLRERSITRDLTWGTPVPLDVFTDATDEAQIFKDKVFYVWFDACIGYVSITASYTEQWEKWWRAPDDVQLYQFMGKDNVPFHSVVFPGSQIGSEQEWFSKSRGIGVFGDRAQETGVPADVWRYYLLKSRPETADSQFEWRSFIEANNSELLAKFGNFVNRVIKFVHINYASTIPDYTSMIADPIFDKPKAHINEILNQYLADLDSVHLREGLTSAMAIAQAGNNFLQSNNFNNKLVTDKPEKAAAVTDDLKPGHGFGKAKYLFKVIDAKKENEWREMYGGTQAERAKKEEDSAKAAAKKAATKAKKSEAKVKKAL